MPSLILATAAQFGLVRAVDWARLNSGRDELAAKLVDNHFYYAPQLVAAIVVLLLFRLVRDFLDLRGIRIGDWLRSSVLVPFVLVLGLSFILVSHLDQIATAFSSVAGFGWGEARALAAAPFFGFVRTNATVRFAIDVLGLLVALLALRLGKPVPPDVAAARSLMRGGEWVRAGELYLKSGDPGAAKSAFRKGKAWAKLAAIEMRDGQPRRAAELYRKAGDGFAWEASRAWEAAGEMRAAEEARQGALASARASSRWDRVAEIAEAIGDHASLAEACRRLAEAEASGPVKSALWKRAADAFRTAESRSRRPSRIATRRSTSWPESCFSRAASPSRPSASSRRAALSPARRSPPRREATRSRHRSSSPATPSRAASWPWPQQPGGKRDNLCGRRGSSRKWATTPPPPRRGWRRAGWSVRRRSTRRPETFSARPPRTRRAGNGSGRPRSSSS